MLQVVLYTIDFVWDGRVPDGMKVLPTAPPVETNRDVISTSSCSFHVHRLMQISEEVDQVH
jgi:hypothetical protein